MLQQLSAHMCINVPRSSSAFAFILILLIGIMDPSQEGAEYLTAVFAKLGVPCRVANTVEKGKHILATADMPAQYSVFEEAPVVSWPSQGYLTLGVPFCLFCLRQRNNADIADEGEHNWNSCAGCGSLFCSESCLASAEMPHRVLCGVLQELRKRECTDGCCRPITKESLANCVAWVVGRIAGAIKQRQFSGKLLEENHRENANSISRQLFHVVTAPFNRFLDAPKNAEFADVDANSWYEEINKLLREPCRAVLLQSAAAPPSIGADWALEIVDGLLRHDTLERFLGILTLNSQGLNGFVAVPGAAGDMDSPSLPITWVLKGGGIYSLQSAFNHSCVPNVAVLAEGGTHDITLRTLRAIKNGEELTITYIPVENTTRAERQMKLEGYFFTCRCPLCEEEK
ncbi:hypothetical protein, conserved [Trypanosoma brucei gambiense DAL972]|uniref:SET domain-containing protein n=1 Tax=Trypanosoma brucei gambiense (strain MHOM/CI/86/DAL972) TaxID=679716 RepID=C9ZV37_TRYB9|nr:hypothetical protein, conserved [Trypanosoma brucei gambiense DAL972]CBH13275.1 hypothetical protein, conserved [Trypanosoma brucei gambiense DAL972]|eukprot:XP_011775552.1 hypothetical protein, conserved [Trypanosoma brucei gambiense DAL972]